MVTETKKRHLEIYKCRKISSLLFHKTTGEKSKNRINLDNILKLNT